MPENVVAAYALIGVSNLAKKLASRGLIYMYRMVQTVIGRSSIIYGSSHLGRNYVEQVSMFNKL